MVGLITMLVSTLGATGMGSILKIIGGICDRKAAAVEAREKRKLAKYIAENESAIKFQEAVFGDGEAGGYARGTRRMLALIGMCNLFTISTLCTIWPSVPLLTFIPPTSKDRFILLWGLIDIPLTDGTTVVITTGHLALATITILASIVGFYFTPAGRK